MSLWFLLVAMAYGETPQPVWVQATGPREVQTLRDLGLGFTETQQGPWWLMHGDAPQIHRLQSSPLNYRMAEPVAPRKDGYRSAQAMEDALTALADNHSDIAEIVDIGHSEAGRPLVAVRLTRSEFPSRSIRILGAHHGDETASAEVTFRAAVDLLEDPSLSHILDESEIWIVPHVNPDGIELNRRYNSNGVDLNRNYGEEWSASEFRPGTGPFSESETRAIRTLADHISFGLGLSVHSGATNIGWVWNFTTDRTPDDRLLGYLANSYAESCTTPGFYTTNGADWYITNGDTTDWSYGRHGTLDFTLEVSSVKSPGASAMEVVLDEHADAISDVLEWPWWVTGRVIDAETGMGLKAMVQIEGVHFTTSDFMGRFSRPVRMGDWTLTASAPGYASQTRSMNATDEPIVLSLEPDNMGSPNPVESRHVDATGRFELRSPASTVRLLRIGHEAVSATGSGTVWSVDHETMAPGPWSLEIDGQVSRNALFLIDTSETRVIEVSTIDEALSLTIEGLGRGTRVWGIWEEARNPVELTVERVANETIHVGGLPDLSEEEEVDLLVWSHGAQIGIANLTPPITDTDDASTSDTGDGDSAQPNTAPDEPPAAIASGRGKLRASACSHSGEYRGWTWLVTFLVFGCRRRSS